MKSVKMALAQIKKNPDNPRTIKDNVFIKLVESLKSFPEMTQIRPIVINKEFMILGGNMRYEAAKEAGYKEIDVIIANNLTPEQEKEFIIKDNISGGDWDFDMLANNWNIETLDKWGLYVPQITEFGDNIEEFYEEGKKNIENIKTFVCEHCGKESRIKI